MWVRAQLFCPEEEIMSRHLTLASALAVTALACSVSQAAFINADFSSSALTTGSGSVAPISTNGIYAGAAGQGWVQSNNSLWSITGGQARRSLSTLVTNELGLAQFVQDNKATIGSQTFGFTYGVTVGFPVGGQTYNIRYHLLGVDTAGTGTNDKITTTGSTLGSNLVAIQTGSITGLTAGASGTVSDVVSLGTGYNYLAVRLIAYTTGTGGNPANYISFDNVTLVPEPTTAALIGLAGFGLARRVRRSPR
jgi:hypothetical protein